MGEGELSNNIRIDSDFSEDDLMDIEWNEKV
jgi:hypothetical protein